jgi:hypothetical protein
MLLEILWYLLSLSRLRVSGISIPTSRISEAPQLTAPPPKPATNANLPKCRSLSLISQSRRSTETFIFNNVIFFIHQRFLPERHPSSLKVSPPNLLHRSRPPSHFIPPRPNSHALPASSSHPEDFFSLPCTAVKHSHESTYYVHNDAKSALPSQLSLPITSTHR